ncbi:N/A [soil metagenome]
MKRATVWLLLAGGFAFLCFLVVLLPARLVYEWAAPDDLRAWFIDGTVFNGSAEEVVVGGFRVGRTRWQLKPVGLLIGRVSFELRARPEEGAIEADVALGVGRVWINDLDATLPLSVAQGLLPIPEVRGDLGLQFDLIRLRDGWPERMVGIVTVDDVVLTQPSVQPVGSYRATFEDSATVPGDALQGAFRDTGGPLEVQGTLVLNADRTYLVEGRVLARDDAPPAFHDSLQYMLGAAGADGRRRFSFSGSL